MKRDINVTHLSICPVLDPLKTFKLQEILRKHLFFETRAPLINIFFDIVSKSGWYKKIISDKDHQSSAYSRLKNETT